jgi:hypothetical protein
LEHLIVELKAPTVVVGSKETQQIRSYAFAVQKDERFRGVPTRWTFWLVANDMDGFATTETRMRDKPEGLLWEAEEPNNSSRIWVKTWAQILHDCRTRLKIFQQALEYSADKDASLEYLKTTYERVLRGVDFVESPTPDVAEEQTEKARKEPTAAN